MLFPGQAKGVLFREAVNFQHDFPKQSCFTNQWDEAFDRGIIFYYGKPDRHRGSNRWMHTQKKFSSIYFGALEFLLEHGLDPNVLVCEKEEIETKQSIRKFNLQTPRFIMNNFECFNRRWGFAKKNH